MTTYTLHLPRDARPGDPSGARAGRAREGRLLLGRLLSSRSCGSSVHRLWLAGLGVLLIVVAFGGLLAVLDVHPLAGLASRSCCCRA